MLARNLGVISFWIMVTLALVYVAGVVFSGTGDEPLRVESVTIVLLVLVPAHVFRSLSVREALFMIPALWVSMAFLAFRVVYASGG